jgi:hypothetical protein
MDSLVDHILLSNIIAIVFYNGKQEAFFFFSLTLFFAQFCDIVNLVVFSKKLARVFKFTLKNQVFPQKIVKKMKFFFPKQKD